MPTKDRAYVESAIFPGRWVLRDERTGQEYDAPGKLFYDPATQQVHFGQTVMTYRESRIYKGRMVTAADDDSQPGDARFGDEFSLPDPKKRLSGGICIFNARPWLYTAADYD